MIGHVRCPDRRGQGHHRQAALFNPRHRTRSLPPGLLPETLDSILTVLRAAERPLRAAQIAERAGVERGTANRYLTYLCDTLIADREPEHGRPGHPAFLYTLASIWEPPGGV